jgi:hypothetical protein
MNGRLAVSAARRCDFTGCMRAAKHELIVRAWPDVHCVPGQELEFRFKKVCCEVHRLNPGPVDGLISESFASQINWGLLTQGKKTRDFSTAKFVFAPLEIIDTNKSRGLH